MHGASNDAVLPSFLFKNFAKNPRLKNNYAKIYQEDKEISREIEAKEINTQQIHSFFQFSKILKSIPCDLCVSYKLQTLTYFCFDLLNWQIYRTISGVQLVENM